MVLNLLGQAGISGQLLGTDLSGAVGELPAPNVAGHNYCRKDRVLMDAQALFAQHARAGSESRHAI